MVSDEALKKLQEQIAAWPMEWRFVVQQLIEDYRRDREDLRVYEDTKLTPEEIDMDHEAAEQLRRLCRDFDLDRLEELVKADKDGRLAVLPLKLGTGGLTMAEYIKRGAFIELVKDIPMWGSVAAMFADSIPAADVAPVVHGRWEQDADGDWYCTNCDEVVAICESGRERTYRKPYCPNCGAKMGGGNS